MDMGVSVDNKIKNELVSYKFLVVPQNKTSCECLSCTSGKLLSQVSKIQLISVTDTIAQKKY